MEKKTILVTGATGYIASWIINDLLKDGHTVHGTVRDLNKKEKYAHLTELATKYPGELKLYEADLMKENSFEKAMEGCEVVMHTASPFFISNIKDPQKDLIDPAKNGTANVLNSCNKFPSVKRVVVTSSCASIYGDNIDAEEVENGVFTEDHWNTTSNEKHQPYSYSKTVAEREAWKIHDAQDQWKLTTVNPGFVMGPSISKRKDSTSLDTMIQLLNGDFKAGAPELVFGTVDVRDISKLHLSAGLNENAQGRYIGVGDHLSFLEMANLLKPEFNEYPLPSKKLPKFILYLVGPFIGFSWKYISKNVGVPVKFDNSRSKRHFGMEYRPAKTTLIDMATQLISDGHVKSPKK